MPYLTTSRGLLGHFLHGADLPATDNQSSPLPVRFPIYLSLWAILAAGAGGVGVMGRSGFIQDPEGCWGWGRQIRKDEQGRRRGDAQ